MPNNNNFTISSGYLSTASWATSGVGGSINSFVPLETKPVKAMDNPEQEKFYNKSLKQLLRFDNGPKSGLIGLEIEVEGKSLFSTPIKYWGVHNDGSLRDTDGQPGVEYVLKEPLDPPEVKASLTYLENRLIASESQVADSYRTSVHVHINVQDLTLKQLYNFILLYLIFEELLVDWSGPDRAGNLFCLRAKDSDFFIQMLEDVLKTGTFKSWKEDLRYSACNVNAVIKFGSLEFRSMRGTVDKDLIMCWINMLLTVREQALTYDNPREIVDKFQQFGPLPFFKATFKDKDVRALLTETSKNVSGALWDGMRRMRDVACTFETWELSLKKKEREENQLPQNQELSQEYVRGGQIVQTPYGEAEVLTLYSGAHQENYNLSEVFGGPRRGFSIQPYHTLYYVHINNYYVKFDIRAGLPENV